MLKTFAILSLIAASAQARTPTQEDLDKALDNAEVAWGLRSDSAGIRMERLNDCSRGHMVAWTDLATRKIMINSACKWDGAYLQEIVTHEVGHLLIGQGHSLNRHSVMFSAPIRARFWQVLDVPHIQKADRDLARGNAALASSSGAAAAK